jgi:hypothetical protein
MVTARFRFPESDYRSRAFIAHPIKAALGSISLHRYPWTPPRIAP